MKIALIGGIYGKDEPFRKSLQMTPETILEQGFKRKGHQVHTASHYARINAGEFDVVHVHHLSFGALRLGSDRSRAAFVFTSHDPLAIMRLEPSAARRWASRWVMSRADASVALSAAEADFQQRTYRLSGALHEVIANGIEANEYRFVRRNSSKRSGPWQLLYVGQLIEQKRVDLLLEALLAVPQQTELSLVYHTASLEAELRRKTIDLGLGTRVRFLGPKRPSELSSLYQEADVFVLPSVAEALPSVITEAMLCGTPIVATDVGGVREQLGGYGVVVVAGEARALAKGIREVLEKYEDFSNQGEDMSQYARSKFSVENMVDRHLDLYRTLIAKPGYRRRQTAFRAPINAIVNVGVSLLCTTK